MILDLQRPATIELEVTTNDGTFVLQCRRPTKADLLDSDTYSYRREFSERFLVWESIIIGWRDLFDPSGAPIPFTRANLDAALAIPDVLAGVVDAIRPLFSRSEQAEKNCVPSAEASTEDAPPTPPTPSDG